MRKQVPKADYDSVNNLMTAYKRSVMYSTMFIVPVSFFSFYNRFIESKVGKIGTFMLSISSTTILTVSNIVFF